MTLLKILFIKLKKIKNNYFKIFYLLHILFFVLCLWTNHEIYAASNKPASANRSKLSLDFQDISVRQLLQLIAEAGNINLMMSDSIEGQLSLHLHNISWDQAFDAVLNMRGLNKREVNHVFLVTTDKEFSEFEKSRQQNPVTIAQQIRIEARIVNIERGHAQEIGNRLGITQPALHLSGSATGANLLAQGTPAANIPLDQRFNFNIPLPDQPAHMGLAIAKLGAGILLDLELAALESEGKGEIISSPSLLTANQQPAIIEAGEEIPYQEATSSGATNVAFKKAVLSLQVTPQITEQHKINLKLIVNQDKRSSKPAILGVPAIDTRHVETQVVVKDGETVVLGGIYETNENHAIRKWPFWGDLPIIGALFRNQEALNQRTELLIFVTPKIVKNIT